MSEVFLILFSIIFFQGNFQTEQAIPPDTNIQLRRYGHFIGPHTSYQLTIFADGTLIIEGKVEGKDLGQRRSKLSEDHWCPM
jgi:hypothetical protein